MALCGGSKPLVIDQSRCLIVRALRRPHFAIGYIPHEELLGNDQAIVTNRNGNSRRPGNAAKSNNKNAPSFTRGVRLTP